ncbi:hypothetical protein L249_0097, partial [Ophiocordyceps polyrhachis-furcata BCC 54312]
QQRSNDRKEQATYTICSTLCYTDLTKPTRYFDNLGIQAPIIIGLSKQTSASHMQDRVAVLLHNPPTLS